jgi:hypothetical protein
MMLVISRCSPIRHWSIVRSGIFCSVHLTKAVRLLGELRGFARPLSLRVR